MDKEELLNIAVECGVTYSAEKWGCDSDGFRTSLYYFAREILERTAQECDKIEDVYWHDESGACAATTCAEWIRAMKGE